MKGETNNKRQAKLLAAVAVMAMVVCALAVAMPAEEADGITPNGDYYNLTSELPTGATYSSETGTLTLENATLTKGINASNNLTIIVKGTNTITVNNSLSGSGSSQVQGYAVFSTGTITIQPGSADASLAVVNNGTAGAGINGANGLTINGGIYGIDVDVTAESKALWVSGAGMPMSISNADVSVTGYERGIRVGGGENAGSTLTINGSTVKAELMAEGFSNDLGLDDRVGIKTGGSITITNSAVDTDGISVQDGTITSTGSQVIVRGGYDVNVTSGDIPVAGLNVPSGMTDSVDAIVGTPGTDDEGIFLVDGAKIKGSVNLIYSDSSDALGALADTNVTEVTVTAGQIPATTVPANKTLVITDDAEVVGDITLSIGSTTTVISDAAKSATVVNGANKVIMKDIKGTVSVTQGSVDTVVDLQDGEVQIVGTGDISGTVASGATLIISKESTEVTIPAGGNLSINGELIIEGYLNNQSGTLTNNGVITLSGTNAHLRMNTGYTQGESGVINGVSASAPFVTSYSGHIYSMEMALTAPLTFNTFYINGVCDDDIVVNTAIFTTSATFWLSSGAAYSGSVSYEDVVDTVTNTASADISAAAGDTAAQILSVTKNDSVTMKVSNSTVSDVSGDVSMENVSFADGMTLEAEITLSGDDNEIPTGHTLILGANGKITLAEDADLYVYGNIEKTSAADAKDKINNDATRSKVYYTSQNKSAVLACVTDEDNTAPIGAHGVGSLNELIANNYPGSVIYLTQSFTITGTVELENVTIYTNGYTLTVGDGNTGATLSLIGCTIDSEMPAGIAGAADTTVDDDEKIVIKNKSVMEYQDSLIFVVVDAQEGSSVEGSNEGVSYDNTASEVRVGYGTTLELKGRTVSAIDVFGDLVVTSTVTLSSGNAMNVYSGGTVTVDGTFSINGTADLKAGSVTVVSESGSITVGSKNGGSVMTVSGKLTVDGSFTVASPSGGSTARNDLAIADSGEFVVNGTMAMNDRFSGQIQDRGDVTINGTSNGGSVKVYAGVTLTVASVSGSMEVTDAGIITIAQALEGVSEQSNGNTITLRDVRGVTITETSETVNWVDASKATHRDYVCSMDISGSITTASNGAIIVGGTTDGVGKNNDQYGTVTVDGELVLTKDVAMTVSGKLDVSGIVSAVIEGSSVAMSNNGVLTVTGTVTVRDNEISGNGTINAAHYELAATADIIYDRHVYTDFKSAVEAAADAVMDTVDILGGVSAGEEVTVDAGITISIAANSRLSVSEGVTVTIADGATVTGYNSSSIRVYGTLTSLDYENDMEVKNIIADVVVTDGAARTWTSLANAVAGAGEGDVITTNGVIVISSDLTIPSGVTVYSEFPVYVTNEATLTVAGTLTMDVKAQAEKTLDGATYNGLGINTGASVVVPGVMSVETQGQNDPEIGNDIDGAHFAISDGAVTINYVSNVAFAAETVSGNTDLIGNVTIKGAVTAGDVEFSVGEDQAAYRVIVANHVYTGAVDTVFAFGTIGLNGVSLVINNDISMASGTVSAPCGDGSSEASVQLSRANGVAIGSASSPLADGTLYTMTLTGISAGSATIASGTVALGNMTVAGGSVLTIASGATATVAANVQISVANEYGKNALVVEGTLDIADNGRIAAYAGAAVGNNDYIGGVTVSGTMQVGTFTIASGLQYDVTGTIAVDDDRVMTVNGLVIVGDKPASLGEQASGSISGTVSISAISIGILAYAGTDLGDADINLNAATGESNALITSYVINGTEYATLYVNSEIPIYAIEILDGGISLSGLSTSGEWYATQQDAERGENPVAYDDENNGYGADVGDYTTVYAYYHPSTVSGTISKDAGIILTIDGNVVNYGGLTGGTGDASFTTSYELSVGTHTIAWSERTGYDYSGVTLTFNGQTVENGGTITITADMQSFTIIASGAVPSQGGQTSGDDGLGLTDYLLIVLVVLIVVMAIMVALRLMRS